MLRIHQWLKNSLLFIPLLAAHALMRPGVCLPLILAFFSFSLCASSAYIINDLHDVDSDRQHPRKVKRPFASGRVPIWIGVLLAPCLLFFSVSLALLVGSPFLKCLVFYFCMTCTYSWVLKRFVLIDCLALAMLYTVRIVAGAVATNIALSFWLLAFSVFLFLSLAFVKRYAELELLRVKGEGQHEKQTLQGRGYYTTDAVLIQTLGVSAGYAAILVMTLYLNSQDVLQLYPAHEIVWGTVPILLFWLSWMWMQATRGKMHDDPLIFAIKDKTSWLAGAAFVMVLVMGTVGWPW
ncbi:MAG TPA: UbiA family prenyltransferase [Legionella sp.]|nr:UbiA family prenyltransferase [Legionella sp.]